ncbi:MAG TPA: hypothetical protein VEY91_06180 [Candidatus Limnocylindria bacterium]|nr:hypothetical protein [Candidatus Limnocylindria bacterium]
MSDRRPAVLLIAVLALFPPSLGSAEPSAYLAWRAAYGEPGASDTLTGRCDNRSADTLFLSFDPGEDVATFYGVTAMVSFHALPGDTLSQRWWWGGGPGNEFNVRVQAGPDSSFATLQPWSTTAMGGVRFERIGIHGNLKMVYVVPATNSSRLEKGKRYCFARLVIPHPPPNVPSCHRPICFELKSARLTKEIQGSDELEVALGPARFATMNSPEGNACAPYRGATRPPAWTPETRK